MKWDVVTEGADWINCDMLSNAADQACVRGTAKTELNKVLVQNLLKGTADYFSSTVLQSFHEHLQSYCQDCFF